MLQFKACPKCGGDLYGECESEGLVNCCLQCGLRQYPMIVALTEQQHKRGGRHPNIDCGSRRSQHPRAAMTTDSLRRPVIILVRSATGALVRRVVSLPNDQIAQLQGRQVSAREPIA